MRILVTGALGFTGRHLLPLLKKQSEHTLYATDILQSDIGVNYYQCNLSEFDDVASLLNNIKPEAIYHLAGTFSNNYETDYATNVLTSRNIFEIINNNDITCRILLVGSAAEYGIINTTENPVKEDQPLRPASVYGLTKVFQTYLMKYYATTLGLDVVMARPFNIFGKGISEKLFVGRVYQQIQQLKNNEISRVRLGNLDNERDYISIEETVKHFMTIMQKGKKGEVYNVGTGVPLKTSMILEEILEEENVDRGLVESVQSNRDQVYDVPRIYADITKLRGLM